MSILDFLADRSKTTIWLLGVVLIELVGVVDYLTGSELSFSVFYLIPISIVTWFAGNRSGIVASCLGAATWLVVGMMSGQTYSSAAIPYWNAAVRLSFFLIVTLMLSTLRANKTLQEEMGHFIVHDLKAPLASVLTGLNILEDIAGDVLDEKSHDVIRLCTASCHRMMSLIASLLDLARLESGKLPLQLDEVSVAALLEVSTQQVIALADRSDVMVVAGRNAEVSVYADRDLTVRILVNLLSNAIKFSPARSTVSINARPSDGDMITFTVTDQGQGIPAKWQDRIFDKYSQVEVRKAGFATGSGLGLTFCRLAVESQGGRIWVESKLGEGTTMLFTLPQRRD